MPAAEFLLMSSNISLLPLCFCFASCNVSRETTALTSVWLTRFSAKKKRAIITPLFKNGLLTRFTGSKTGCTRHEPVPRKTG